MGHIIVKPKRDEDFYVDWSSIVDAPSGWGTRAELMESLHIWGHPGSADPARFDRADELGSSARSGEYFYEDDEFFVREIGPTPFLVDRANLRAFCESLSQEDQNAYDASLTRPDPDWAEQA